MAFCASRTDDKDEQDRNAKLKVIGQKLDERARKLFNGAYASAVKFIESKASNEEGHGGSGRGAWVIGSQIEQKNAYLELVEKVRTGFKPAPKNTFVKADQQLNTTYKKVISDLKRRADKNYDLPRFDDVRVVQRLWITYRDASVKLFTQINPAVSEDVWKSWLTEIREKELQGVLLLF